MTNLNITDRDIEVLPNLHLCSLVLEPELDLPWIQIKISTELKPCFLIGMRTLFEQSTLAEQAWIKAINYVIKLCNDALSSRLKL